MSAAFRGGRPRDPPQRPAAEGPPPIPPAVAAAATRAAGASAHTVWQRLEQEAQDQAAAAAAAAGSADCRQCRAAGRDLCCCAAWAAAAAPALAQPDQPAQMAAKTAKAAELARLERLQVVGVRQQVAAQRREEELQQSVDRELMDLLNKDAEEALRVAAVTRRRKQLEADVLRLEVLQREEQEQEREEQEQREEEEEEEEQEQEQREREAGRAIAAAKPSAAAAADAKVERKACQHGAQHTAVEAKESAPKFVDQLALLRGLAPGGAPGAQLPAPALAAAAADGHRGFSSSFVGAHGTHNHAEPAAATSASRMEALQAQRLDGELSDEEFNTAIRALVLETAKGGREVATATGGSESEENLPRVGDDELGSHGSSGVDEAEAEEAAAVERAREVQRRRRRAQMAADHEAKLPGMPETGSSDTTMVEEPEGKRSGRSRAGRMVERLQQAEAEVVHAERAAAAAVEAARLEAAAAPTTKGREAEQHEQAKCEQRELAAERAQTERLEAEVVALMAEVARFEAAAQAAVEQEAEQRELEECERRELEAERA